MAEQDTQNEGDAAVLDDESGAPGDESSTPDSTIGRIALKQVRVSRAEAEARTRDDTANKPSRPPAAEQLSRPPEKPGASNSPLNRLVPYLDLFARLNDEELSRLARTPTSAVETLRQQVDEVNRVLARYVDLLPRLTDDELTRLTGGTAKTIRFWRLCQPRTAPAEARPRVDVPQPSPRETSAVRSVVQAYEQDSVGAPVAMQVGESGTMIVDEQIERFRRD